MTPFQRVPTKPFLLLALLATFAAFSPRSGRSGGADVRAREDRGRSRPAFPGRECGDGGRPPRCRRADGGDGRRGRRLQWRRQGVRPRGRRLGLRRPVWCRPIKRRPRDCLPRWRSPATRSLSGRRSRGLIRRCGGRRTPSFDPRRGWVVQHKFLAPDGELSDRFGTSVAIDGDTAVIGAPERDPVDTGGGSHGGLVFVFVRSGAEWTLQAELHPTDGFAWGRLRSVASVAGEQASGWLRRHGHAKPLQWSGLRLRARGWNVDSAGEACFPWLQSMGFLGRERRAGRRHRAGWSPPRDAPRRDERGRLRLRPRRRWLVVRGAIAPPRPAAGSLVRLERRPQRRRGARRRPARPRRGRACRRGLLLPARGNQLDETPANPLVRSNASEVLRLVGRVGPAAARPSARLADRTRSASARARRMSLETTACRSRSSPTARPRVENVRADRIISRRRQPVARPAHPRFPNPMNRHSAGMRYAKPPRGLLATLACQAGAARRIRRGNGPRRDGRSGNFGRTSGRRGTP
jgi:hypothetical protein